MKIVTFIILILLGTNVSTVEVNKDIDPEVILEKVDENLSAENRVLTSSMTIHGRRQSRTIVSKTYAVGTSKSYTEYLEPAREKGTKMLKLDDKLWIYSPDTDRTIQLSGHLLKQSVMGSDLSYEDMMEDESMRNSYEAVLEKEDEIDGRKMWVLKLTAKIDEVNYHSQKMWIDQEYYVPRRQELFAKSGQLLKSIELSDVQNISGRWFPMKMVYKDELKSSSKGTEFHIQEVQFNQDIPDLYFNKSILKK